jgi:ribonuclease Z
VEDFIAQTPHTYAGPLVVGEDLMTSDIGETVTVRRAQPQPAGA